MVYAWFQAPFSAAAESIKRPQRPLKALIIGCGLGQLAYHGI